MSTVPEIIESALGYGLKAAAHAGAYARSFKGGRETPARDLNRSAHYWAQQRHEEAADMVWRCVGHATVTAAGPEALPEGAP